MKQREERRTLLWEGEPVLVCTPPDLAPPPGAPRRAERWRRRLEAVWRKRWEGPLYRRACAALGEARAASRPFQPWQAALAGAWTEGEGLLCLRWEAAETVDGRRRALWGSALWSLPRGAPVTAAELLGRGWRRWARAQVSAQIESRLDSCQSLFYPDWRRRLGRQIRGRSAARQQAGRQDQGTALYESVHIAFLLFDVGAGKKPVRSQYSTAAGPLASEIQ